jgi:hypothetical protein
LAAAVLVVLVQPMGREGHPDLILYLARLLLLVVGQVAPMEPLRQIKGLALLVDQVVEAVQPAQGLAALALQDKVMLAGLVEGLEMAAVEEVQMR